jgi:hypothetical protein
MARAQFLAGARDFSLYHSVQTSSGVHRLPIQWVWGTLSLGLKRPGCEADYFSSSGAEVKNGEGKPLLSHMSSWCGLLLPYKNMIFLL